MQQRLRAFCLAIAVIVSGLSVVALGPAPPASAAALKILTQGSLNVQVSHTSPCNQVMFNELVQAESWWLRRFDVGQETMYGSLWPLIVRFGVDQLRIAPGRDHVKVRVRVYRYPTDEPLSMTKLQQVGYTEAKLQLTALPENRLAVAAPIDPQGALGTVDPQTEDAVVEIYYQGRVAGERFTIGSNDEPETASGYTRSACWTGSNPFPDQRPVIALEGVDLGFVSDLDGDDLPDNVDRDPCPRRPGPLLGDPAGCPSFDQTVTATYVPGNQVVSGDVSVTAPDGTGGACQGRVTVNIFNVDTGLPIGSTETVGLARSFSWNARGEVPGTRVFAQVDRYLDVDAAGEGIGVCRWGESPPVTISGPDSDFDGVPDAADACDTRAGTVQSAGCPYVQMKITAAPYADEVVSGTLAVADPRNVPETGACQQPNQLTLSVAGASQTYVGTAAAVTGAFTFAVAMDDQQHYALSADAYLDRDVAWCGSAASDALTAFVDDDEDGVRNRDDECPNVPDDGRYPNGCPAVDREFSLPTYANNTLSGTLTVADPSAAPAGACLAEDSSLLLTRWRAGVESTIGGVAKAGTGAFAIPVSLVDGDRYSLHVEEVVDPAAGWCSAATTVERTQHVDADADGVSDAVDHCAAVHGAGTSDGCPVLEREFTGLSYAGAVVTGSLRFTDSTVNGCSGARSVSVTYGDSAAVVIGEADATTGAFEIEIPEPLGDGDAFVVSTPRELDEDAGWCAAVETDGVVEIDLDNDGVLDGRDSCREVAGDAKNGCPTVERRFSSLTYVEGMVVGNLTRSNATGAACAGEAEVEVTRREPGEPVEVLATGTAAATTGAFEIPVSLADGIGYHVSVDVSFDPGLAWCAAAVDEVRVASDSDHDGVGDTVDQCDGVAGPEGGDPAFEGCPRLVRTVTASYAGGAITGRVSVLGPNPAPAGTCLPTRVRAFNVRDGVPVRVGATTTTSAEGSYSVALDGHLAAGSTYFVTIDRELVDEVAVCDAAESARHQVPAPGPAPVVTVDPPGGAAPEIAPLLTGVRLTSRVISLVGGRATPRATTLTLSLSAAAKVRVTVKGTSKATGKPVVARVSKTFGAGGATLKLKAKVGTKRLPPGTYTVTVRATATAITTAGAATATVTAGKLKVRP